jgi:hypothetical protein
MQQVVLFHIPLSAQSFGVHQATHAWAQIRCRHNVGKMAATQIVHNFPSTCDCCRCNCRLANAAIYCGRACLTFVERAEELQAIILPADSKVNAKLLNELECLLEEACCFFTDFSARQVHATLPTSALLSAWQRWSMPSYVQFH